MSTIYTGNGKLSILILRGQGISEYGIRIWRSWNDESNACQENRQEILVAFLCLIFPQPRDHRLIPHAGRALSTGNRASSSSSRYTQLSSRVESVHLFIHQSTRDCSCLLTAASPSSAKLCGKGARYNGPVSWRALWRSYRSSLFDSGEFCGDSTSPCHSGELSHRSDHLPGAGCVEIVSSAARVAVEASDLYLESLE